MEDGRALVGISRGPILLRKHLVWIVFCKRDEAWSKLEVQGKFKNPLLLTVLNIVRVKVWECSTLCRIWLISCIMVHQEKAPLLSLQRILAETYLFSNSAI
jgi:isoprenylcysteine carboxyl methyltransferase (ICMT) family protein YpbQ